MEYKRLDIWHSCFCNRRIERAFGTPRSGSCLPTTFFRLLSPGKCHFQEKVRFFDTARPKNPPGHTHYHVHVRRE